MEKETAGRRSVMGQLNDKLYEESRDSIDQLRATAKHLSDLPEKITQDGGVATNAAAHVVNQLDDVPAVLVDKQKEVMQQLEVKLRTTANRLTRSEARCGEMIKERQRMVSKYQVMAQRLDEAEGTSITVGNAERRIRELQSALSVKETQLKKLRTALNNVKQELVQTQESAAESAAAGSALLKKQQCSSTQLEKLTHENAVLAKDAENAIKSLRKAKEHEAKKTKTLESLQHENSGLYEKLTKVQALLTTSQTELDELKKYRGGGAPPKTSLRQSSSLWSSTDEEEQVSENGQLVELRARVQLLSAQNTSLRKAIDVGSGGRMVVEDLDNIVADAQATAIRAEKHRSWELEKKLRLRGDALEKKLDEKIKEVMKLETKLVETTCGGRRVGERATTTTKEKVTTATPHKFGSNSSAKGKVLPPSDKKGIPEAPKTRKQQQQGDMFVALDKARIRIFELEEEIQVLRRAAEVELPADISTLSYRLRSVSLQLEESDAARILAEQQLKAAVNGNSPVDEEIWQNEADALKGELKALKAKQRKLDEDILERDASAMSLRFDLESAKIEVDHLKRRNTELLEVVNLSADYEQQSSIGNNSPLSSSLGKRMRCSGGQDVEGVIDAMKCVIEKFKLENDRLKRAAGDTTRLSETERKLRLAKGKVTELQEEISMLRAKVQAGDESVSLLARKREQYNLITRKLRTRESELEESKKNLSNIEEARRQLELEMESAKKQILNWTTLAKGGMNAEHGNSSSPSLTFAALLRGAHEEMSNLQSRLAGMERDKERMAGRIRKAEGDQGAYILSIQTEMDTLEDENERLRSELEPFDLAFFEEIEDLKHEHAVTLDRLRQYEAAGQSVGPISGG